VVDGYIAGEGARWAWMIPVLIIDVKFRMANVGRSGAGVAVENLVPIRCPVLPIESAGWIGAMSEGGYG
jgi:hypothetical protein